MFFEWEIRTNSDVVPCLHNSEFSVVVELEYLIYVYQVDPSLLYQKCLCERHKQDMSDSKAQN